MVNPRRTSVLWEVHISFLSSIFFIWIILFSSDVGLCFYRLCDFGFYMYLWFSFWCDKYTSKHDEHIVLSDVYVSLTWLDLYDIYIWICTYTLFGNPRAYFALIRFGFVFSCYQFWGLTLLINGYIPPTFDELIFVLWIYISSETGCFYLFSILIVAVYRYTLDNFCCCCSMRI